MGLDFVGWAPEDVHVAAIGFPARNTGGETFVGVGDAAIVFFTVAVFGRIWIGIAPAPEFLDVLFAFFVGGEAQEGVVFFLGDNVRDLFRQPGGVGSAFLGEFSGLLLVVLLPARFAGRIRSWWLILCAGRFQGKKSE